MIRIDELLGQDALTRYDDHGEPLYTCSEQIVRQLRWFDWVTAPDLFAAMEILDEGHAYTNALRNLETRGYVERRGTKGRLEFRLVRGKKLRRRYKLDPKPPQKCTRCKEMAAPNRTLCQAHIDYERNAKRIARSAA